MRRNSSVESRTAPSFSEESPAIPLFPHSRARCPGIQFDAHDGLKSDIASPEGCHRWTRAPPNGPFDHLVEWGEQRWRQHEAEYLRGLQVNYQLEYGRLLDGQFGGSRTFQNTIDEDPTSRQNRDPRRVHDKASDLRVLPEGKHCRESMRAWSRRPSTRCAVCGRSATDVGGRHVAIVASLTFRCWATIAGGVREIQSDRETSAK